MGSRILIAEPEFDTATFLKTLLEREGHHVRISSDTVTAMEALQKGRPQLLIVDALLPGAVAEKLIRSCTDLPKMGTSAIPMKSLFFRHPLFDFLVQSKGTPVPFLEKPLQEDELFELVDSLLSVKNGKRS